MLDALTPHVDAEAASSESAVCVFSEVGVQAPRGRFEIEMHLSYLAMSGQVRAYLGS